MKSIAYYLSRTFPAGQRRALVERMCARRCGRQTLNYPEHLRHVRSLLMVLPEDVLTALCHVENTLAISEHFAQASVTIFCRSEVAEYFHSIAADASFVEYDVSQRYLFSPVFARYGASLAHEHFDLCFLLDTNPDLAVLDLVGRVGARIRAGYAEAADYPLLNHIVRMSGTQMCLAERYSALARSLGAHPRRQPSLQVNRDVQEGVAHLLRDLHIDLAAMLVTVDVSGIATALGREWTADLLERLRVALPYTLCCPAAHGESEDNLRWIAHAGVAVVPPLTVPRLAALLERSQVIVTCNTPLLQLATLLERPTAAVLARTQSVYVRPNGNVRTVFYDGTPGQTTVETIIAEIKRFVQSEIRVAALR